jgi:hypothetical protein
MTLISIVSACGGDHPAARVLAINLTPHSASPWAQSAEDSVSYHVSVEYSDGRSVPLTSGVNWSVDKPWVHFDSASATATCVYSAQQEAFFGPEEAIITASATIEGQTFKDNCGTRLFLNLCRPRHRVRLSFRCTVPSFACGQSRLMANRHRPRLQLHIS